MKTLLITLLATSSAMASSGKIDLNCVQKESGKMLTVQLRPRTSVAVFENTDALSGAQMPVREPIGFILSDDGMQIAVKYDWHYSANYAFGFSKHLLTIKSGDSIQMTLNGDDDDGSSFSEIKFTCSAVSDLN